MNVNNQTNANEFSAADIIGMVTGIIGCVTGFGVILYVKLSGSIRDKKGTKVKLEHAKPDGTMTKMSMNFTNDEKVHVSSKVPDQSANEGYVTRLVNWVSGNEDIKKNDTHTSVLESPVVPARNDIPSIMPEIVLEHDVHRTKYTKGDKSEMVTSEMFREALLNNNKEDQIVGDNRSDIIKDMFRLMAVALRDDITTEKAHSLIPTPRSDSSLVSTVSMNETADLRSSSQQHRDSRYKAMRKRWNDKDSDKSPDKSPDKEHGITLVQIDLATSEIPQSQVTGHVDEEGL